METFIMRDGNVTDTVLNFYNNAGTLIKSNDDRSPSSQFSYMQLPLSEGATYKVKISKKGGGNFSCYFAISIRSKEYRLLEDASSYARHMKSYNCVDKATNEYNCLAYAIGNKDTWLWPFGGSDNPSLSTVTGFIIHII